MNIIKEYCINKLGSGNTIVLRSNTYANSLKYFMTLFKEAKKSFPELRRRNVQIIEYAGNRYKHTFGIEFFSEEKVLKEYELIDELESTL